MISVLFILRTSGTKMKKIHELFRNQNHRKHLLQKLLIKGGRDAPKSSPQHFWFCPYGSCESFYKFFTTLAHSLQAKCLLMLINNIQR